MITAILTSLAMAIALFFGLKWRSEEFDVTTMVGLSVGILLLWIIPNGILTLIPLAILVSIISPAGREEWKRFSTRRVAVAISLLLILNLSSLSSVSTPVGNEEWDLIATENPYASAWPASEQWTWTHSQAVISVLNLRSPHTWSAWGQASSSIELGILLGMHNDRMRQSIETMNENFGTSIPPESFTLHEVETEGSHTYGELDLHIARFELKMDGFDFSFADVLVVGISSFGGELTILSITRPVGSTQGDVFEEAIVLQYLESQ